MNLVKRTRLAKPAKKTLGFTLIECLVALFIIALVLASSTRAIGLLISDVRDSYAREVANWIADNAYSQFYIDGVFPNPGPTTKNVDMAGLSFILYINVVPTPNPYFHKVGVNVSEKSDPKHILFQTVYFMAKY